MAKEQIIRFVSMAESYPDPFEACLLLDYSGCLSVGCWISIDEENRKEASAKVATACMKKMRSLLGSQ